MKWYLIVFALFAAIFSLSVVVDVADTSNSITGESVNRYESSRSNMWTRFISMFRHKSAVPEPATTRAEYTGPKKVKHPGNVPPPADPIPAPTPMTMNQIENKLWPDADGQGIPFVIPTANEMTTFADVILKAMEVANSNDDWNVLVNMAAQEAYNVESWSHGGKNYIALLEQSVNGGGSYVFRRNAFEVVPFVLEAPHSFHDTNSGKISARIFFEQEKPIRVLMVNTIHRYVDTNGVKNSAGFDPADSVHTTAHLMYAASKALSENFNVDVAQIHGMNASNYPGVDQAIPTMIVSGGKNNPTTWSTDADTLLGAAFPNEEVDLYPTENTNLGATTNTHKSIHYQNSDDFLHVETEYGFRTTLKNSQQDRDDFITAVFDSR